MPGRIVGTMSTSGANGAGPAELHNKGPVVSIPGLGKLPDSHPAAKRKDFPSDRGAVNGVVQLGGESSMQNGLPEPAHSASGREASMNGMIDIAVNSSGGSNSSLLDLPPEILHIAEGYVSLGKLIERVTQQSFLDFTDLVERLSHIQPSSVGINGSSHLGMNGPTPISNRSNDAKRLEWLSWANSNREKFIKLMVLSSWAKANSESIKTLIDLMVWSNEQSIAYERTATRIGELKRNLYPFRLKNPDIATALDVLSTGMDSRMPDLNYLPLEPLTNESVLRTLKNMNTLLRIRLNLHEELPQHLRDWKVVDGRATFTSPEEFEFDVTIADEDPSIQLYFVDMRFLFQPAPELGESTVRKVIQFKSDEALSGSGVSGCFDFLRNFVLTHQISTLYDQALELSQETWTGTLKIEMVHRWLIVQYWADSPFPKSWIEIGISSEAGKKKLWPGHVRLPQIQSKWKRYGEIVDGEGLSLQLSNLSIEGILQRAIARHTLEILRATRQRLQDSGIGGKSLHMQLEESVDEPAECKLHLQLGRTSPVTTLLIEPITGHLCLQPATELTALAENDLNRRQKNPLKETWSKMEYFLCTDMLQRIERQAVCSGWEIMSFRFLAETVKVLFGVEIIRYGFFKPSSWRNEAVNWVLATTINLTGEQWWAVEIKQNADGPTIATVQEVFKMKSVSNTQEIGFAMFKKIAHLGLRALSLNVTVHELRSMSIKTDIAWISQSPPFHYRTLWGEPSTELQQVPTVSIDAKALASYIPEISIPANTTLKLWYGRLDEDTSRVKGLLIGNIPLPIQGLTVTAAALDSKFKLSPKGYFYLKFDSPIGTSLHVSMIEQLNRLIYSTTFLKTLNSKSLTTTKSSLSAITFTYPQSPNSSSSSLECEVTFSSQPKRKPILRLLPSSNPHLRIKDRLEDAFSRDASTLLSMLEVTLPVLRALQRVELNGNQIRTWNWFKYRIAYRGASTVFEVTGKMKHGSIEWWLWETRAGAGQQPPTNQRGAQQNRRNIPAAGPGIVRPPGYEEAIKQFFSRTGPYEGFIPGVRELGTQINCGVDSIEQIIGELDSLVRGKIAEKETADNAAIANGQAVVAPSPVAQKPPAGFSGVNPPNRRSVVNGIPANTQQPGGNQFSRPTNVKQQPGSGYVVLD